MKSHGERKPDAAAGAGLDVSTFELDDGTNRTALLEDRLVNSAAQFHIALQARLTAIFAPSNQGGVLSDDAITDGDRMDQQRSAFSDANLHQTSVDDEGVVVLGVFDLGG